MPIQRLRRDDQATRRRDRLEIFEENRRALPLTVQNDPHLADLLTVATDGVIPGAACRDQPVFVHGTRISDQRLRPGGGGRRPPMLPRSRTMTESSRTTCTLSS